MASRGQWSVVVSGGDQQWSVVVSGDDQQWSVGGQWSVVVSGQLGSVVVISSGQ